MKKLVSVILAAALLLCGIAAFAEEDLQAQLDAANARIAELEAEVAVYKPVYESRIAATYGADGVIWVDQAKADYDGQVAQLKQYGIDPESMGLADKLKQDVIAAEVESAILDAKIAEQGFDQFTDEEIAELTETASQNYESYISYYVSYAHPDATETTEEMRAEADAYWQQNGITVESIVESQKKSAASEKLHDAVTADVQATEEDVQAAYDALVASNKESYANDRSFSNDRNSGKTMAWIPEGYRAVKQVLIKFGDDQQSRYDEISGRIGELNAEKAALDAPAEETAEEADEETAAPRSAAEIDIDLAAANAELEALYAELDGTANEVVEAFNAGTSIEELIEKYNGDPGMTSGLTAEQGYAVCEGATAWDPAFTAAAMSISEKGGISEPANGSYGKYIVYYMDDIPAGEVGLESIRDALYETAQADKVKQTYDAQVAAWVEEAAPVYHPENL